MSSLADDIIVLRKRETGTGAARALRREGNLPGVIYGKGIDSLAVSLDSKETRKMFSKPRGHIHQFKVEDSEVSGNVMIQDVEFDSIMRQPLHVDLRSVSMTDEIRVDVSILVIGEDALVKRGLLLQRQIRDVQIECLPSDIPEYIQVDVSDFNPGDTVTVADLPIPENTKMLTSPEEVVAVALAPRTTDTVEDEEQEGEEIEEDVAEDTETEES